MAEKHGMTSTYGGRCPALVRSSGKYWCSLVLNSEGREKADLAHALKIGARKDLFNPMEVIHDQNRSYNVGL